MDDDCDTEIEAMNKGIKKNLMSLIEAVYGR